MIVLSQLQLPTESGTHQVTLDEQSADMLRALAGAWNQRVLLERVKTVTKELDHPDLRRYVERDLRYDLQETLANDRLTALWLSGPEWFKAPKPPEGRPSLEPENQAHVPLMPYFWVCRIRALVLPMAAWDGASWLPK